MCTVAPTPRAFLPSMPSPHRAATRGAMQSLDRILSFLDEIRLPVAEGPVPEHAFLPGVRIDGGVVVYDRAALRWPGDLLHEAGHIAVTPSRLRPALNDGLDAVPAAAHAGEAEATAWAYAAVVHLRLEPSVLFHDGGYGGHSEGLIRSFAHGVNLGAHGLAQAGMTAIGTRAQHVGVAPYPRMLQWLRD
jgi:hypothetical protein